MKSVMKKFTVLTCLVIMAAFSHARVVMNFDFDNPGSDSVSGLQSAGWVFSDPTGTVVGTHTNGTNDDGRSNKSLQVFDGDSATYDFGENVYSGKMTLTGEHLQASTFSATKMMVQDAAGNTLFSYVFQRENKHSFESGNGSKEIDVTWMGTQPYIVIIDWEVGIDGTFGKVSAIGTQSKFPFRQDRSHEGADNDPFITDGVPAKIVWQQTRADGTDVYCGLYDVKVEETGPKVDAGKDVHSILSLAQAGITMAGSYDDPNSNTSGVEWSIVTTDAQYPNDGALSSTSIVNPIFTTNTEGRYLLKFRALDADAAGADDPNFIDYVQVNVGSDSDCLYAKSNPLYAGDNAKDFSSDCIVNFLDFAGDASVDVAAIPDDGPFTGFATEWGTDLRSGDTSLTSLNNGAVIMPNAATELGNLTISENTQEGNHNTETIINKSAAYTVSTANPAGETIGITDFLFYADDNITGGTVTPFVAIVKSNIEHDAYYDHDDDNQTPEVRSSTLTDPNTIDFTEYETAFEVLAVGTTRTYGADFGNGLNIVDFSDTPAFVTVPDGNSLVIGFQSLNNVGDSPKRVVAYDDGGSDRVWHCWQGKSGSTDQVVLTAGEAPNVYWVHNQISPNVVRDIEWIDRDYQFAIGLDVVSASSYTKVSAGDDLTATEDFLTTGVQLDGAWLDPDGTATGIQWSVASGPSGSFSDNSIVNPVFTGTTAGEYTLELTVIDPVDGNVSDQMVITYSSSCDVAKADSGYVQNPMDFDDNCVVDITDLGDFAAQWLSNSYQKTTDLSRGGNRTVQTSSMVLGAQNDGGVSYNKASHWVVNMTDTYTNLTTEPVTLTAGDVTFDVHIGPGQLRFLPLIMKVNSFEPMPNLLDFDGVDWVHQYETEFTVKAIGTPRLTENHNAQVYNDITPGVINTLNFNDVAQDAQFVVYPGETIAISYADAISGDISPNGQGGWGQVVTYSNDRDPNADTSFIFWGGRTIPNNPTAVDFVVGEYPDVSGILGGNVDPTGNIDPDERTFRTKFRDINFSIELTIVE